MAERAEEKLTHRRSLPEERIFRISVSKSPTLTAAVVAFSPPRTRL